MPVWTYVIPTKSTLSPCGTALGVCRQIDASAANNVWVSVDDTAGNLSNYSPRVNIYQWNGSHWINHPFDSSDGTPISCTSLRVFSPTDVWMAAGGDIQHWDGTAWITVWAGTPFAPANTLAAKNTNTVAWVTADSRGVGERYEYWTWDGTVFNVDYVTLHDSAGFIMQATGTFLNDPPAFMRNDGALYFLADRRIVAHELHSLIRLGPGGAAVLREYPDYWNMHSLWRQDDAHGWSVGIKEGAVYPPLPVIELGMGGGWGEETAAPIYYTPDSGDGVELQMYGIGGKDESDVLVCGWYSVAYVSHPLDNFHGWVIDRRKAGVWTHYSFPDTVSASIYHALFAIHWIADDDIWVVGGQYCTDVRVHTKILHWNGSSWENTRAIPPGL